MHPLRLKTFVSALSGYLLPTGAVILFLLLWMKSQAIDPNRHNRYISNLLRIQELDARINQNVLQARLGLLPYYDPIVHELAKLKRIQADLQQIPVFLDAGERQSIDRAIELHIQLYQDKESQIEQFKSQIAILRNSESYFPVSVNSLLQNQTIDPTLAALLNKLLQDVLLFNLTTSQELKPQIEGTISQILAVSRPTAQRADVERAIAHARIILTRRPQGDRLVNNILSLPTGDRGEDIAQAYYNAYQQALDTASLNRLALYLLSTLLIIGIATSIIWKLRTSAIAVQQSEAKLRAIFENSLFGIFRVRLEDGLILAANQRCANMLGHESPAEIVGHKRTIDFYVDPSQRQQMLEIVQQQGEINNFEQQFRRQDGTTFWGLFSARLNVAEACLEGAIADISDRHQAEAALQASEAELQVMFAAMTDTVIVFDAEGRYLKYIPKQSLAYKPRVQRIGKTVHDILPKETADLYLDAIRRTLYLQQQSGDLGDCLQKSINVEYYLPIQGKKTWFSASVSILSQNTVLWVARDISDRKATEVTLAQAKEAAEVANHAKTQFLSHMSHELRTPLSVILGFTQLLTRSSRLDPKQQEYLDTISRSGEHLLTLINDVLEMSKIEADRIALNEQDFNLHHLLDGLQQMFQFKATSKGLEFTVERSPDLPECIRTDESKLRQVLVNLIGNAIKFTQAGSVTLRVSFVIRHLSLAKDAQQMTNDQGQMTIHFSVEDTGVGIASAEIDRLFDPFVQAEAGISSQEGTGLGLPISRKFVQLMGGNITVESRLGEGSCFEFYIQAENTAADVIPSPTTSRQVIGLAAGQPAYRILIVEDKPSNRQLLLELLQPVGFDVREAENGREAIAIWQSWQPHLIWMDLRMPVMDGYAATKQIKSAPDAPIIIVLTGSAFEEERQIAVATGCDDFIRKPFRAEVLFEKMTEYLGVQYIYKEEEGRKALDSNRNLHASSLQVMPVEWIEQLRQAAICVNAKLLHQLIAQIPLSHASLAQSIAHLVNNFQFEEIVTLTSAFCH
ncbi:DAHL domain-containing protein [Chroococcidiopsis sp.]|uniref:DAHL domain-containing protein n=1 Tax=Chroococcidiopsis sp. TaxID=3088168 RepID=UPI003F3D7ED8